MTRFAIIAALIIAIVMAMGGTASAQMPGETMDAPNQPAREADSYIHGLEGNEEQTGEEMLETEAHPAHEVGDDFYRVIGVEEPPREVVQSEIDVPEQTPLSGVDQCTSTHTIDASDPTHARQQFDAILSPFREGSLMAAKFILCIEITNGPLLISSPIVISTGVNTSQQTIIEFRGITDEGDGLPIKATADFSGNYLVKIQSAGPTIALVDWGIDGQGTNTCLKIDSADNTVVVSSTIRNCAVNVRIVNSNYVRLGPKTDEEFLRWNNDILDYSLVGILVESGHNNTFAYNIIFNYLFPKDIYGEHAITIENRANTPLGKMQTVSPPNPVEQETADGKTLVTCTQAPDGVIRPRLKFANPVGKIVWYRPVGFYSLEYMTTCNIGGDGICYIYHPEFVDDECDCHDVRGMNALYTSANTSEFMEPFHCPATFVDRPGELPSADAEGAVIPTPAPDAADDAVDVTSLATGATGGCGKSGGSLLPNNIATSHAPSLGLWWIVLATGIVAGVRGITTSATSRKRQATKGRSRS